MIGTIIPFLLPMIVFPAETMIFIEAECCVCLENPSTRRIPECGMVILCLGCSIQLKKPKHCPICRVPFSNTVHHDLTSDLQKKAELTFEEKEISQTKGFQHRKKLISSKRDRPEKKLGKRLEICQEKRSRLQEIFKSHSHVRFLDRIRLIMGSLPMSLLLYQFAPLISFLFAFFNCYMLVFCRSPQSKFSNIIYCNDDVLYVKVTRHIHSRYYRKTYNLKEDMVLRYWVSDTILDITILSVLNILAFFGHWMWALLGFLSYNARLNIS